MFLRSLVALFLVLLTLPASATTMLLTGVGAGAGAPAVDPFRYVWASNSVNANPVSPLTLATQGIGTVNPNRFVIVAASWKGIGNIGAVTINGVTATRAVYSAGSGCCGPSSQAIWQSSAKVPAGITASIVFSGWSAGQITSFIAEVGTLHSVNGLIAASNEVRRAYPNGSGSVSVPVTILDQVFVTIGNVDSATPIPTQLVWQGVVVDNQTDDAITGNTGLTSIVAHLPVTRNVSLNVLANQGAGNWGWVGATFVKP